MRHVTAVLEEGDESRSLSVDRQVLAAADATAALLAGVTQRFPVPTGTAMDRAGRVGLVVEALRGEDVVAGALSARGADPLCWDVITQVATPVVVVPKGARRTRHLFSRVLLPMDGHPATAAAVADVARRALETGASVRATHVFDATTVPAFWDQAAYSGTEWTREFARRNLPEGVTVDLRRGRPPEEVLAEAEQAGVDLLVIGWNQDLSAGRAITAKHALVQGSVPVLLVPNPDQDLSRA